MIPISEKLSEMLNEQASRELGNSLLYKHFTSWAHTKGLKHIAAFFKRESEGEVEHHNMILGLLDEGNAPIAIPAIPAKPSSFKDCEEIARLYMEAEAETTEHLEEIYQAAELEKAIGISNLFQGMLQEQIEEEGLADRLSQLVSLANGNLIELDLAIEGWLS
jgi:ferritin